jgi:MoxR-like ATPase
MTVMNITQAKDMLMNLPIEIAILISGNHDTSKSQIIKQVAKALDVPCIDFQLSQNSKEADAIKLKDLLGLIEDISLGRYGDKGILFLDGINKANQEVQRAVFELALDRKLNHRGLPEGWRVATTITGDDSIYADNLMESAFLDRLFIVELQQ